LSSEQRAPVFGRPFEDARGAFTPAEKGLFDDLRGRVKAIYGRRLLSVKLVGSRARGTAKDTSDYDFLIFLESCDYAIEVPRLEAVSEALSAKHGLVPLSLSPMSPEQFHGLDDKYQGITGSFMRDAVNLWP